MSAYPHLFSPLDLGPITVRNRVLISAHVPGFAENNKPGAQYIAYHQNYAKNGVGLQITGGTPVHPSGLLSTGSDGLWNLDDSITPGYERLSAAVHAEGGRILAQLAHSAGTVLINQPGRESWSASAVRSETTGNISHEMTRAEISEVIEAHAFGAARAINGNMDGIEILGAFGYLPQAFLSPLTNKRKDNYGGSLDNRLRFLMELLEAVRSVIGEEKVLGVRLPGDEFEPGGLDLEQMKIICLRLAESGLINYLNIIAHTNISHLGRSKHWAPTPTPHGVFVHLAAAIREVVRLPVFAVGRIVDPMHAEDILARGQADMVGMTRAHICDPQILPKLKGEVKSSIRICAGANVCISNRYAGKPIRCIQNALLPTPGATLEKTLVSRRIAIIGAGPAGLECARIAAERGHHVKVYEASDKPGGQLALWARAPSRKELGRVIDWRVDELARLQVPILFHRLIDVENIKGLNADYPKGAKTLVLNEGRGQAGLTAAEMLVAAGVEVEIVTSDIAVAADLDPTNRTPWYQRLGEKGCNFLSAHLLKEIKADQVVLENVFDGRLTFRFGIDLVVDWSGAKANDALINDQGHLQREVHSIGDCRAPRTVEVAISEATALALKL